VGCAPKWNGGVISPTSQMSPKSHDSSRDSLFILKHATDFTGKMLLKPDPLRKKR